MIHHSVPGERSFAVLQEAVYQNSNTYRKSDWARAKCPNGTGGGISSGKIHKMKPNGSAFTVSAGTGHHIYANASELDESEQNIPPGSHRGHHHHHHSSSNPPPAPPDHPPPLPPKRTTSLFDNQYMPKRDSFTVNPKRISIATSTFWDGHPDLGHFVSGWELGREGGAETNSVWGTTERGGNECMNIWGDPPAVKKGILLLQRDKLLSRWKERYCILTRDYLHCFRRTTSIHRSGVRLSEMGTFIFKLRLADVETIEWESRKSGPIIAILLPQESRLLMRTPSDTYEALEQWHTLLQECIYMSKERRRALRHGSSTNVSAMTTLKSTLSKASEPILGGSSEGSNTSSTKSSHSSERTPATHPFQTDKSSMRKNVGRMSLKLTPSNGKMDNVRKYAAPLNDVDEDQDYEDVLDEDEDDRFLNQIQFPVNKRCTRASIAVVERSPSGQHQGPAMTLHDFVKNPWKSNNLNGSARRAPQYIAGDYSMPRDAVAGNRHRPESWGPQPPQFYKTPIMDSNSSNSSSSSSNTSRNGPSNNGWGKNSPVMVGNFSRGRDSIYSTSRHTSEITFRKMS